LRGKLVFEMVTGIALLALSLYLYLLYQALEAYPIGFSGVASFTLGSLLVLWNIKPLEALRRIVPFIVAGAAISLALITFRIDVAISNSYYGDMLAYGSSRLSWLVLTLAGVNVQLSNYVLIFPNGRALAVGPLCGGAYSSLAFLLLYLIMVADMGRKAKKSRLPVALSMGLLGVNLANMFRITFLASVTYSFGLSTLEVVHQFAGYAVFVAFMSVFWLVSIRWLRPRSTFRK